jgi:hypothetical protein
LTYCARKSPTNEAPGVLRDLGVENRLRQTVVPQELMGTLIIATSFAGLSRTSAWVAGIHRGEDYKRASPSQPDVQLLARAGTELASDATRRNFDQEETHAYVEPTSLHRFNFRRCCHRPNGEGGR